MRFDKLTNKFQMAIADAQSLALGRDHQFIEPVHIMHALLTQDGGAVRPLLTLMQVDHQGLRQQLTAALDKLPKVEGTGGDVQLSSATSSLLNLCDKYAQKRNDQFISSELFVLAATEDKGALGEILRKLNVTREKLEKAIEKVRGGEAVNDQNAEEQRQ